MSTVLITGASSGMGRSTAELLARSGHHVFAGVRSETDGAALRAQAAAAGLTIQTVLLDVRDTASVEEAVRQVLARTPRIDALVNNAGYGLLSSVEEATDAEMREQFEVNVMGVLRMCRAVLPAMRRQRGGVIVNVSSFLGCMGLPLLAHYNASKHAVEGITTSLRHEVRPFNIRVHSVMPGLFGTNFVKKGLKVSAATSAAHSPYAAIFGQLAPAVATKINGGPDPIAVAEAVKRVIEDAASPIRVPVGVEATTFVPLGKQLSDEAFEAKVRETFGL